MEDTITGVVKDGVVVPDRALPEGARVEVRLAPTRLTFTPEEQAEFDAWNRASDSALELVERLAQETGPVEAQPWRR